MRLAQTCGTVDEQRVVRLAGSIRNRTAGRVSKPAVVADHKRIKGETPVEQGDAVIVHRRGGRFLARPAPFPALFGRNGAVNGRLFDNRGLMPALEFQ
jgi:hypothetical protein